MTIKPTEESSSNKTSVQSENVSNKILEITLPCLCGVILISILVIFIVICCKKRRALSSCPVEVAPCPISLNTQISIIEMPDSPIYCEATERLRFCTSTRAVHDVDTQDGIVKETQVGVGLMCINTSELSSEEISDSFRGNIRLIQRKYPTHSEEISDTFLSTVIDNENEKVKENQYQNTQNEEDVYETIDSANDETEQYAYAYGHVNIDDVDDITDGYVVMNKRCQSDDDEYEYEYAYDWMTSTLRKTASEALLEHDDFLKGNEGENFDSNYEAVLRDPIENVETSEEVVDVEYVKVL